MFSRLPTEILNIIFKDISSQDVFNFYMAASRDRASKNSANYYLQRNFLYNKEKEMLDFDLLFPLIDVRGCNNANEEMRMTTTTTTTEAEVFSIYSNFVREGTLIFSETPKYKRPRTVRLTLSKYNSAAEKEGQKGADETSLVDSGVEILQNLDCGFSHNNTLIVSMDDYKLFIKIMREIEKQQRPLTNVEILDMGKTTNNINNDSCNFNKDDNDDFIEIMKGVLVNIPKLRVIKIRCECELYPRHFNYQFASTTATTNTTTISNTPSWIITNRSCPHCHRNRLRRCLHHRRPRIRFPPSFLRNSTQNIFSGDRVGLSPFNQLRSIERNTRSLLSPILNRIPAQSSISRSINNVSSSSSINGNHIHESLIKRFSSSNLRTLYVDIAEVETLIKIFSSSSSSPSSSSSSQGLEKIGIRLNHYHFASTVIDSDQLITLVSEVFDKVRTIELNLVFSWEEEKLFPAFLSLPRIIRKCNNFPWKCGDRKKDCSNKKNLDTLIIAVEIDGKRVREWTFKEKKKKNNKDEDNNEDEEMSDDDDDDNDIESLTNYYFYWKDGDFERLVDQRLLDNNKLEIEVPACLLCYMIHAATEIVWHYVFSKKRNCLSCYCRHRITPVEEDINDFRDIGAFRRGIIRETTKSTTTNNKGNNNNNRKGGDGGGERQRGLLEFRIPSSCALNSILSRNIKFENNDTHGEKKIGEGYSSSFQFEEVRHLKLIFDLSYMKKRPSNDICQCVYTPSNDENIPMAFHEMDYNGFDLDCSKESPTISSFCQCNYIASKIPKTFPNLESLEIRRDNCPPLIYRDFFSEYADEWSSSSSEEEGEEGGGEREGGGGNPPLRRSGGLAMVGFEKLRELKADYVNNLTTICDISPSLEKVIISYEDDTVDISNICEFLIDNMSLKCIEFNFDHYLQNKKLFRIQSKNYRCCWLGGGMWYKNRSLDIVISLTDERLNSRIYWKIRVKENLSEYIKAHGNIYENMYVYRFYDRKDLRAYLKNAPNPSVKIFNIFCPYFNHHDFLVDIFEVLKNKIRDKI